MHYKLLIIIQLGTSSHSSQIAEYATKEGADLAYKLLKEVKSSYAINVTKLYN